MSIKRFIRGKITEELSPQALTAVAEGMRLWLTVAHKIPLDLWEQFDQQTQQLLYLTQKDLDEEASTLLALKINAAKSPLGYAKLMEPFDGGQAYQKIVIEEQLTKILQQSKAQFDQQMIAKGAQPIDQTSYIQQQVQKKVEQHFQKVGKHAR